MTRKDYQLIAAAFHESVVSNTTGNENKAIWNKGIRYTALALAGRLASDNPHFDRARFLKACGVEE